MADITQILTDIFNPANQYIWYVAFVFLIGLGLYFTYRLKFMQILKVDETSKLALTNVKTDDDKVKVSSFEAFCIGMGARIGVGNIAGVATAIVTGGPGAVFWMWIFAIIGSASSFMESVLAQLYKEKKSDGGYHGGPAYYASKGLKSRNLGILLAALTILAFGVGFVGVQASNCSAALGEAFQFEHNDIVFGALIAAAAAIVFFGGVKKIGKFTSTVVPLMALAWIAFALIVVCMNFSKVPMAIEMIFKYAFDAEAIIGGGIGTVILTGLKRGVFSNEAGLGSVANVAATANVKHPAKQGMIQSFGVLVDTLVVCSVTAFVVLSFGDFAMIEAVGAKGSVLVQKIMTDSIGSVATYALAIFMLIFAFTSMVGYYTMSESNMRFIKDDKKLINIVRAIIIAVAFLSCLIDVGLMDLISDTFMALMGAVNMIVVGLLSKQAIAIYKDYRKQKDEGIEEPVFHKSVLDNQDGITEWD
ncbi:MAG: alanine/glycine:cation symporter family protein [Candidatus Methanomethylophilaceae archaeon]|nr:alanine/glycine:cation symporter family protein [Candidatus Methanomethylophilaceae archaeon]